MKRRVIAELNLLSLCFLNYPSSPDPLLAIAHIDHFARSRLVSRSLLIERDKKKHIIDIQLSPIQSPILLSTAFPEEVFPIVVEAPPKVIPVEEGVLVVGGRNIVLHEFAPKVKQEKAKGKQARLEAKKASVDAGERARAREKEKERECRERKPGWVVEWPWSEVVA